MERSKQLLCSEVSSTLQAFQAFPHDSWGVLSDDDIEMVMQMLCVKEILKLRQLSTYLKRRVDSMVSDVFDSRNAQAGMEIAKAETHPALKLDRASRAKRKRLKAPPSKVITFPRMHYAFKEMSTCLACDAQQSPRVSSEALARCMSTLSHPIVWKDVAFSTKERPPRSRRAKGPAWRSQGLVDALKGMNPEMARALRLHVHLHVPMAWNGVPSELLGTEALRTSPGNVRRVVATDPEPILAALSAAPTLVELVYLRLDVMRYRTGPLESLEPISCLQKLEVLEVRVCGLPDRTFQVLSNLVSLQELKLIRCTQIRGELFEHTRNLGGLSCISLDFCDRVVAPLASTHLGRHRRLTKLCLLQCNREWQMSLHRCSTLVELDLWFEPQSTPPALNVHSDLDLGGALTNDPFQEIASLDKLTSLTLVVTGPYMRKDSLTCITSLSALSTLHITLGETAGVDLGVLSTATNLNSLQVTFDPDRSYQYTESLSSIGSLRKLISVSIKGCRTYFNTQRHMLRDIGLSSSLAWESLSILSCDHCDAGSFQEMTRLTNLTSLSVHDCRTALWEQPAMQSFGGMTNLRSLSVDVPADDAWLSALAPLSPTLRDLLLGDRGRTRVKVGGGALTVSGLRHVGRLTGLMKLDLRSLGLQVSRPEIRAAVEALSGLTELRLLAADVDRRLKLGLVKVLPHLWDVQDAL